MTAPLLNTSDLTSFQESDPDWFVQKAGETIRAFCQWHIAPSIDETITVPIQPDGTIMLPSMHVTSVTSVTVCGTVLDPSAYVVHEAGYIHHIQHDYFQWPLWPLNNENRFREYPSPLGRFADVEYTHGYDATPDVVVAVAMELANRAMELPSGVATQISSGPYTIGLGALGMVLTDEQRRRLGPYTLVRF